MSCLLSLVVNQTSLCCVFYRRMLRLFRSFILSVVVCWLIFGSVHFERVVVVFFYCRAKTNTQIILSTLVTKCFVALASFDQ